MKRVFSIMLVGFVFLANLSKAQTLYWWLPQNQLVPAQENSANVFISGDVLVWEHQVDSATTAIYYNCVGNIEPICLLFTPGVKYTKPSIHGGYPYITIFFEANQNDNSDIFLILVDDAGNPITEMQQLTTSPANDHGLQYIENCWPRKFAWLENETLKVADLVQNDYHFTVSNIVTVDSLNCSSPVVFEYYNSLYWIKNMEFFDVVRVSNESETGWTTPVNVDTANQIEALKNTTYNYQHLQWTFKEDTNWLMMDYFPENYNPSFVIPDVSLDHPFDFDVCDIGYGVKSSGEIGGNFFQAYIKNQDGFDEVFLNQDYDINTYYNFSNMGANCRNPQFFIGEYFESYTFMFYVTWESFIDNAWHIYYSKTPITWGGIEENENSLIKNLLVSPNPFRDEFEISFDVEKSAEAVIDLVDIHGRLLQNLYTGKCDGGSFSKQFNLSGKGFTGPGLIRFQIDGNYAFVKIIRMK